MSLVGFKGRNHPQQTEKRGAKSSVDDRETPEEVFGPLHDTYHFTVDAAASAGNAKLPRYWDTRADGLLVSWTGERVWCNPPYSKIEPWVRKAWTEEACPLVVMILPANRTEQGWWQDLIEPFRDRPGSPLLTKFLRGRTRFIAPGLDRVGPNERPPFGCALAIWDRSSPVPPAAHQLPLIRPTPRRHHEQ